MCACFRGRQTATTGCPLRMARGGCTRGLAPTRTTRQRRCTLAQTSARNPQHYQRQVQRPFASLPAATHRSDATTAVHAQPKTKPKRHASRPQPNNETKVDRLPPHLDMLGRTPGRHLSRPVGRHRSTTPDRATGTGPTSPSRPRLLHTSVIRPSPGPATPAVGTLPGGRRGAPRGRGKRVCGRQRRPPRLWGERVGSRVVQKAVRGRGRGTGGRERTCGSAPEGDVAVSAEALGATVAVVGLDEGGTNSRAKGSRGVRGCSGVKEQYGRVLCGAVLLWMHPDGAETRQQRSIVNANYRFLSSTSLRVPFCIFLHESDDVHKRTTKTTASNARAPQLEQAARINYGTKQNTTQHKAYHGSSLRKSVHADRFARPKAR